MPARYVQRLERRSGGFVDAVVSEGTQADARYWHHEVKSYIAPRRLDSKWNWPRMVPWYQLIERIRNRHAVFLKVSSATSSGHAFPIGQLLLSDGYPFFPDARNERCVLLLYLAAAPAAALSAHGLPTDLKIMRPLVDTAIQFSFDRGYDGRMTLHAAKGAGGQQDRDLYDKYKTGCKLKSFRKGRKVALVRPNDGRYFYVDEGLAVQLTADLNYLR